MLVYCFLFCYFMFLIWRKDSEIKEYRQVTGEIFYTISSKAHIHIHIKKQPSEFLRTAVNFQFSRQSVQDY
jgi:hypothetical protein